jgi:hypothetical protein
VVLRRRRKQTNSQRVSVAPTPTHSTTEDLVFGLLRQTQQLNDRLSRLEERFEASVKAALSQADSNDLIELRLHSARLAAELSRVTVELRAEIDEMSRTRNQTERALRASERGAESTDRAESTPTPAAGSPNPGVIDLTERRARNSTGWQPISDE